jgi:hypothetical protein
MERIDLANASVKVVRPYEHHNGARGFIKYGKILY